METIKLFHDIVNRPLDYAKEWKQSTRRKVIGYFCSYTPEEILWAAGVLPFRIFGSSGNISKADEHLQAYSCRLVRGALDDALSGKLDFLDGAVFPHTCDSIQRLSDIWRLNAGFGFHADIVLPVKLNTDSAATYMADVLRKFKQDVEKGLGIEISSKDLKRTVGAYNRIRAHLKSLYQIRQENPDVLNSSDLHAVVKASMIMDRDDLLESLSSVIESLEKRKHGNPSRRKRLVLSGGICSMPDIYTVIENSGGAVVWDDFCTGARYFDGAIDPEGDILESIARRYLNRMVCPAKHSGLFSRAEHLVQVVKESRADGVIFLFLKFCDPHAFDYPYLRERLEKENIPSMVLELDDPLPFQGALKTRCEAFLELL